MDASSTTTASTTTASGTAHPAPWDPPPLPRLERVDHTAWYWGLGVSGLLLVLLFVLAVLYRRGVIFRGSGWKRRPSHAQPWKHWGDARSRMPSLFDLFNAPQRKKSAMNPGVSLHAAETAFSTPAPAQQGDAPTVRVQVETDPARSISAATAAPQPDGRLPTPSPHRPGMPLGPINERPNE